VGLSEATAALRAEWEKLLEEAKVPLPYASLDWIAAWSYGFRGGPVRLHLVRSGGKLVAALPLVQGWRTLSGLPVRALYTPSLNIAFSETPFVQGQPALDALLDGLLEAHPSDILLLRGAPRGGTEEAHLRAYLAARALPHTVASVNEISIDASQGLEGYRAGRRSKFWSNVRNRRKRLDALGKVEFERHRPPRDPARFLAEACQLSMRSWKFREGTAIMLLERYRRFLGRLLAAPATDAWILRLDGKAVAFRILYVARGVAGEIEIAHDEELRALSPGNLLAAESNEALIREGVREIGSAGDHAWKDEWSPARRERLEFVVFREGLYARLVARAHGFRVRRSGGEVR
jgi:CelD/BcsL family acetyltransferase involved in cellulose biosynthesis